MTYDDGNRNDTDNRRRRMGMGYSDGSGWGVLPLILGVLFIFALGYLIFGGSSTDTTGVAGRDATVPTTTAPKTTPTTPPANTPPATPPANK
jgi:hypothetical protein